MSGVQSDCRSFVPLLFVSRNCDTCGTPRSTGAPATTSKRSRTTLSPHFSLLRTRRSPSLASHQQSGENNYFYEQAPPHSHPHPAIQSRLARPSSLVVPASRAFVRFATILVPPCVQFRHASSPAPQPTESASSRSRERRVGGGVSVAQTHLLRTPLCRLCACVCASLLSFGCGRLGGWTTGS